MSTFCFRQLYPIVPIRHIFPRSSPNEVPISMPKQLSKSLRTASPSTFGGITTPVTFGILTTDTMKQAFERSGGIDGSNINKKLDTNKLSINKNKGNAGFNAAITAIKMSKLLETLDVSNYSKQSQLPI